MGAIAGWATTLRGAPDPAPLGAMVEALAHRARGESVSGILDRSPRRTVVLAASLNDPASRISLALDGAILNAAELRSELGRHGFAFRGESDAEVLLRAYQYWDKEAVKQLRGAFALALWDARKERLMLARDRFGQKPLYLHSAGPALAFASELEALARAGGVAREVDVGAVGEYLAAGYVRGPRTLLKGVRKLAPGSYALWQYGSLHEVRYWSAPDGEAAEHKRWSGERAHGEPVEGFIERLDEAVRLAARGAPRVGAFLSAGFDSAAIVALMRRHCERIVTFSAGFAEDRRSELGAAARLAKHFATEHHELVLSPRDILAELPRLAAARDAPLCRPSDIALHLLARQAGRTVRVALSGDGGDEVLGGYRRHTFLRGFAPRPARPGGLFVIPVGAAAEEGEADARTSPLRRILYYEQVGWLPDNLLERADRMSAAASLDLRAPFVDHRLAEYVSALPDAARVRGLTTKRILREADRRLLADSAVKPRKAGFRISLADPLRGEMRDLLDLLRGPGSAARAYCDGAVLDRLLDEHLAVRKNHEEILWTLLNLEIWHRAHLRAARTDCVASCAGG
ncbi:MAG TPA: asparagine synthase-related protein [Burkholderiales bacterium]